MREQVECWKALKSSPADENKFNVYIHDELVSSRLMFYFLLFLETVICVIFPVIRHSGLCNWWLKSDDFSTKLPAFAFMCGVCAWPMGGYTNVMKLSIQMNYRSTLESFRLFMFNYVVWANEGSSKLFLVLLSFLFFSSFFFICYLCLSVCHLCFSAWFSVFNLLALQ